MMQFSSQNASVRWQSRVPQASSATTRAAGEHSGSSSHTFKSSQLIGSDSSDGTAHCVRSPMSNSTSSLGTGCSVLLQLCQASTGAATSRPDKSGRANASSEMSTRGAPFSKDTEPQSSISNPSPSSRIVMQSGSSVFKLTATFTAHEAPVNCSRRASTSPPPHSHWYT